MTMRSHKQLRVSESEGVLEAEDEEQGRREREKGREKSPHIEVIAREIEL